MIEYLRTRIEEFQSHNGFVRYFRNTSWLLIEKTFRLLVGFFVGIWVVRYLGPEQFGLFSYVESFVALFAVLATMGIDQIVVRELVKFPDQKDVLLGTAFVLKLVGVFLTFIFIGIGILIGNNDGFTNILILIFTSTIVFKSFSVIDLFFQSKVLSRFVALANLITMLISSGLKILFIITEMPLMAFVIINALNAVFLAFGLIYFYQKQHFSFRKWIFDSNLSKRILMDSWPIILSGMLLMIQARIDQIMIKEMLDVKELGYYSASLRFVESVAFFPAILASSLFPAIQNARSLSKDSYYFRLVNFYRLNFILFLLVAIPVMLFSKEIIELLFGIDYMPAAIILKVMALRLFFANMGTARGIFILSENLFKFSLFTMGFGTVTNVILNFFWIQYYGPIGAVYASILSFSVTIFLLDILFPKTRANAYLMFKAIISFFKIKLIHK